MKIRDLLITERQGAIKGLGGTSRAQRTKDK